ncbi:dehydrodolichyl diphosphate synthase complex subunit DHDDS-like isoform X1 [Rhipicephalus microplus]|uniref:dehydrodolichyl diphosphate synthase complex subunit DHDDS-like isoform X1 n=2 Tax=Rhipicephalus microplus TaxID=6941 RepID=UPI003F6CE296
MDISASETTEFLPTWDVKLNWHERVVLWVLRQGIIPRHAAIVPDGNRRFAKKNEMNLSKIYAIWLQNIALTWHHMSALGVTEVSGFLLSARNFSRNTTEIGTVLDELKRFFIKSLHSLEIFSQENFKVSTAGSLDLLSKDLRQNMARIETNTDADSRTKMLRLCIAYSSKVGLKNMVNDFANAVKADVIESDDICPCLVTEWLALNEASETELWFRSSGERRFSEFLVLQSGYAHMHREAELWPAVSIWHWVRAIVHFQLNWPHIKAVKENHHTHRISACDHKDLGKIIRQRFFLRQVKSTRMARVNELCVDEPTPIDRNSL